MPVKRKTEKTVLQNLVETRLGELVAYLESLNDPHLRVGREDAEGFTEMHYTIQIAVPLSDKKLKESEKRSKDYGL